MNIRNTIGGFLGGLALGVFLTLNFGALGQGPVAEQKKDWSHVSFLSFPSGATGIFDPATGRLYLYDANWQYCFAERELTTLGDAMRVLR